MTLTISKDVLKAVLNHLEKGITSKVNVRKIQSIFVPVVKKALKEVNDG